MENKNVCFTNFRSMCAVEAVRFQLESVQSTSKILTAIKKRRIALKKIRISTVREKIDHSGKDAASGAEQSQ